MLRIILKFYNDSNLYRIKPLNEIASEKINVTPTKLSTASETHGDKQLISLNGNKDSKICLKNNGIKPLISYEVNNVKPLNEKSHPIDRIINKYY